MVVLGGFALARAIHLSNKIFVGQTTTTWQKITGIFHTNSSGTSTFTASPTGQINILLLGIGGEGHDGPYLTDTMILAQIKPSTNEVSLTAIPRDYWTKMPDGDFEKINAAFTQGYLKKHDWNQGGQYAIQVVQNISGMTIPYFAVIDFSGFEKAINQVGGVDVHVDRTFTDYSYPDSGTGYLPPLTFTEGDQHLDGTRALEFARSRHAAGIEGSDFSRSQRQQKIIQAFESKIFTNNLVKDAGTINSLMSIFADHFHTNLNPGQLFQLYNLEKGKSTTILSSSLDPVTGLICPEILASNNAYVLTPCADKSEEDVKNFFKNSFDIGKLDAEKSTVWLATSTGDKQAYDTALRTLTDAGIMVYQLSYSKDNLPNTIVYQANPKPATVDFIKNELQATENPLPPPGVTVNKNKVDVIVVLGVSAVSKPAPQLYIPPPARVATTTSTSTLPSTASTTVGSTASTTKITQ